ncbi:MAG: hypothetical protein E7641_06325 [Ruminococcaceae bacterium]|nr:hypothetical protein [Oscillospiraceae bacterium]
MKKIALALALLLIFSLLASCNEGDTPPENTTTVATTTAATTTVATTTTTTAVTTQALNKYSIGDKTMPDDLADELDRFIMSIDSKRWGISVYKTVPQHSLYYFGELRYDVHSKDCKSINDYFNDRHVDLTESETASLYAILERAMNS